VYAPDVVARVALVVPEPRFVPGHVVESDQRFTEPERAQPTG